MEESLIVKFQVEPLELPVLVPQLPIIPLPPLNIRPQGAREPTTRETDPLTGGPVHRFWDEQTQSHFFTASETEFSDRQSNPARYRYEGVEFNAPSPDIEGALPVYRFENQQTGTFFYTLQSSDTITGQFPVLESDGIAFYAFSESTAPSDAVPVYRFFNENASASTGTPVHFFTGTEENKDNVIQNVSGFSLEGSGWYALAQDERTGGTSDNLSIADDLDLFIDFDAFEL
ncbi:MAG: hypothetical protein SXA11_18040 [Cyanobacteriota bacterium]|nr:hypothetical protein [Cyanobacteriota bacterium]